MLNVDRNSISQYHYIARLVYVSKVSMEEIKADFLKCLQLSLPLHPTFYLDTAFFICCITLNYMFGTIGNPEGLGSELLETLVKMAPTKEEEIKLRDYCGDTSKLGSAERFLKAVLDIPFAFKRVEAMLYRANFDTEVKYLRKSFQTLEVFWLKVNN
jgi:hypothetical protein